MREQYMMPFFIPSTAWYIKCLMGLILFNEFVEILPGRVFCQNKKKMVCTMM